MNISSLIPVATSALASATTEVTQSQGKAAATIKSLSLGDKTLGKDAQGGMQERRQAALSLVNRSLTMAYEKISSRGKAAVEAYENVEPLTATKVASNILGFIERRLQLDAAEGATQEQLKSRLEAGLSGFNKGFAEASEQLKALSMLSPEVEADISQTKDLVLKGIDELRSRFIADTKASEADVAVDTPPVVLKSAPEKPVTKGVQLADVLSRMNSVTRSSEKYDYARASEFSFELTTAEGDKVTIRASASVGVSGSKSQHGDDVGISSSQALSLQVEGELNDEELAAIGDLMGRVNNLADQFFAGNLDEAFAQAESLGYDETQIGSYALHLAQVEIEIEQTPEANVVPKEEDVQQNQNSLLSLSDQLFPLGGFIQYLLDTMDIASIFDRPEQLLTDMGKNMVGQEEADKVQGARFGEFMEKLLTLDLAQDAKAPDVGAPL